MNYISDIVTKEEIDLWEQGQRILIHSQTGSGKSHFIKNNLYEYCLENDKKILLLSNRTILKDQNSNDLEGKLDIVHPENYQLLETRVLHGEDINDLFIKYDYIIYDECHYLFSDSQFSRTTDLLIEPLINTPENKIFVFMTATPDAVLMCQPKFHHKYTIPFDYSYINNIYFYSKSSTINQILSGIPDNEKVIYFSSNAMDAYELSLRYPDSDFICSESNSRLKRRRSQTAVNDIINHNTFYSKLLCTTKVLDNGVNLIDKNIKHIIIDMLDPTTLIQCIGRRRIVENDDGITLYIKNYHGGYLYSQVDALNKKLKYVKDLETMGIDTFKYTYRKYDFDDVIQNDFTINKSKLINYQISHKYYLQMMMDKDKSGYKKMVYRLLNQPRGSFQSAESKFEKETLSDVMEPLINQKMFGEEIDNFKTRFFENIFDSKKVDYRKRGILCTNAILQEDNLPYQIISSQETKGKYRKKRYWMVIRK